MNCHGLWILVGIQSKMLDISSNMFTCSYFRIWFANMSIQKECKQHKKEMSSMSLQAWLSHDVLSPSRNNQHMLLLFCPELFVLFVTGSSIYFYSKYTLIQSPILRIYFYKISSTSVEICFPIDSFNKEIKYLQILIAKEGREKYERKKKENIYKEKGKK